MTAQPRDVNPIAKKTKPSARYRKGTFGVEKRVELPRWKVDELCRNYRREMVWCELEGRRIACWNSSGPFRIATETHHRRERSAGGYPVLPANLLALCEAHHLWVHSDEGREEAKAFGALVEREDAGFFELGPDDRREA